MKKKKQLQIQGYSFIAVGFFLIYFAAANYSKDEALATLVLAGFIVYSFYKAYASFSEAREVPEEEPAYVDPVANASEQEKISYYKRILLLGAPAFIGLSWWIIYELNSLESGESASVTLWGPVSLLYDIFGYWVAVLSVPALGIFSITTLGRKLYQAIKSQKSTDGN